MIVLLHSSKTMRPPGTDTALPQPILHQKTLTLQAFLRTLSAAQLATVMQVSPKLAAATHQLTADWNDRQQRPAIDSFLGDIYSGLQVSQWSSADRQYAQAHLRILSGLYGILRPLDGIYPYRLEMGYRLPDEPYRNLYNFWGDNVSRTLPDNETLIDLTAAEYGKVLSKAQQADSIRPKFLSVSPKTGQPTFVVVHAKIARGAFAGWLIRNRINAVEDLPGFAEIGYRYDPTLSSLNEPVYICQNFGGLGLSVRLS